MSDSDNGGSMLRRAEKRQEEERREARSRKLDEIAQMSPEDARAYRDAIKASMPGKGQREGATSSSAKAEVITETKMSFTLRSSEYDRLKVPKNKDGFLHNLGISRGIRMEPLGGNTFRVETTNGYPLPQRLVDALKNLT